MALPFSATTAPVDWSLQYISVGGWTIPVARLEVPLHLGVPPTSQYSPRDLCWLDTGAPLSVVPFHVHHRRLAWQAMPGISTTWAGQACDLGRIDVWFATEQAPYVRGPLPLLAKFARDDPPGDLLPVLLGLEFFLAHQAELTLRLPPGHGVIRLP